MNYYTDKHILITGAASGLGRLLAEKMGELGANLILLDIDVEGLESVKSDLVKKDIHVEIYACDLSDRQNIIQVTEQISRVDILVNNAGFVTGKYILDAPDELIKRTFQINILAHFWLVKQFLPEMLERDSGHVVTIASAGGLAATPRMTDYCSSKFAAVGFDESLRLELRQLNSKVLTTVVCPFVVDTELFAGAKTRFNFLLPILKKEYVVKRIIKAVANGKRRLIMPRFIYSIFPLRLLSPPKQDALLDFFGANKSMDDFVGKEQKV